MGELVLDDNRFKLLKEAVEERMAKKTGATPAPPESVCIPCSDGVL